MKINKNLKNLYGNFKIKFQNFSNKLKLIYDKKYESVFKVCMERTDIFREII